MTSALRRPPEQPLVGPGRPSRRRLLQVAGAGGLLLLGGGWLFRALRGFGPPAPGLTCFDEGELAIVEHVAEAFFPGPPQMPVSWRDAEVAAFADAHVSGFHAETAQLFRTLLRAINLAPVLSYGHTFCALPLAQRRAVLEDWRKSRFVVRRSGYQSLRFLCAMGYFEHPRVRAALGLRLGCPGVEERLAPRPEEGG